MRKSRFSDNQGKCCDAILRILEEREGAVRSPLIFPEKEHHSAPVELVCTIGTKRFALEHTKLEAYREQIRDGVHFTDGLELLETELKNRLPNDGWFTLIVPANSFQGLSPSKVKKIRQIISAWVIQTAPLMKLSQREFDEKTQNIIGVPFPVTLEAIAGPAESSGRLKIARFAPPNIEALRSRQISIALAKKLPKLEAWAQLGSQTVLILESEDLALTNHGWVLKGLKHDLSGQSFRPDRIFFVYAVGSTWLVQTLLADGQFPNSRIDWWPYREFQPTDMADLMA